MYISLTDLAQYTATFSDGAAKIEDLFLDSRTRQVHGLFVDIGGWLANEHLFMPKAKIAGVSPDTRAAEIWATPENLRAATDADPILMDADVGAARDILQRGLWKTDGAYREVLAALTKLADTGLDLIALNTLMSREIAAEDGTAGRLVDFLVEPGDLAPAYVVVDTGLALPKRQFVVPVALLTDLGSDEDPAQLQLTRARIESSPPLERFTRQDRHWFDQVTAYYGLSLR
ncbi:MAG: hypothetical protein AAF281_02515 [Pseudomonadota bacterium]